MTIAFSALAREAFAGTRPTGELNVSLHAARIGDPDSPRAVVEWRGTNSRTDDAQPGLHAAFAARVIEAHGGVLEITQDKIRVTLPLSE
jgi:hypothetical protein